MWSLQKDFSFEITWVYPPGFIYPFSRAIYVIIWSLQNDFSSETAWFYPPGFICPLSWAIYIIMWSLQNDFSSETHTCHTSHCETKSHRILALLDPISHKIFKSHRIFIPFHKLLFEALEINHTLAWLSQAYFIKIMAFNLLK